MTSPEEEPQSKTLVMVVMVILGVLSATGTAGNALVLYVFARKRDRLVSTLFIIVLASVDFVTCLVIIPMTMYMEYFDFYVTSDILCRIYQFLITSNIPFSALIMVAIAVDRYLSICHPFLRALNPARAKVIIVCLVTFAAALGLCVSLMFSVYGVEAEPGVPMTSSEPTTSLYDDMLTLGSRSNVSRLSYLKDDKISKSGHLIDGEIVGQGYQWMKSDVDETTLSLSTGHHSSRLKVVFRGYCAATDVVISREFQYYYQKFYTTMFLVCLLVVIALYALIYRTVLDRRARRQSQKSQALPMVVSLRGSPSAPQTVVKVKSPEEDSLITEESRLTTSGDDDLQHPTLNGSRSAKKKKKKRGLNIRFTMRMRGGVGDGGSGNRKKPAIDGNRLANLKMAAMLFVVTVTFIVTFMPAFLMAMTIIPYNIVVFYLYFANNVANPVIYSFMNKNFRHDLQKIFTDCSRSRSL